MQPPIVLASLKHHEILWPCYSFPLLCHSRSMLNLQSNINSTVLQHNDLTRPNSRSRRSVTRWLSTNQHHSQPYNPRETHHRIINIKHNSRISRLICSGKCHQGTGSPCPTTSNCNLTTRDIELCSARALSDMQADVFDAEEIVAARCPLGDCEGYRCRTCLSISRVLVIRSGVETY